jgi:hypothetical protein
MVWFRIIAEFTRNGNSNTFAVQKVTVAYLAATINKPCFFKV